ncbi:MAG TPA: polymer-forming cytoskeletal protein [Burkholderiales bacterium]|nr:polymer-forming cytoskeletal protein [Burkholderiales bacterium]
MFGAKPNKPQNRIDCLIGTGTRIEGNVVFSGGLRVDGQVRGNIVAEDDKPGTLVVSEQAQVEGEIRVPHVVINGVVTGPVNSTEYVELQAKANVTGDVYYNTLEMQLGAVVQGRLVHQNAAKPEKVVQLKPASGD